MCVSTYVGLVDDYLLFFYVVGHVCSFLTECSIISILSGKPILRFGHQWVRIWNLQNPHMFGCFPAMVERNMVNWAQQL